MKRLLFSIGLFVLAAAIPTNARADWRQLLGTAAKAVTNQTSTASATSLLSQDQMIAGLKEALGKGVQNAVAQLGKTNGFLGNLDVKIPMPEKLQTVEKTLRSLKQEKLADDFVLTMNRAAEQAVPVAASVFADSIKQMTIADAKSILTGKSDEATQYFRKTTQTNLFAQFLPIVKKATESNNVTGAYKNLMAKSQQFNLGETGTTFGGAFGNVVKSGTDLLNKNTVDLDSYVTEKAMDGLFKMVAAEEKKIRENPAARTTELLQKVFGTQIK